MADETRKPWHRQRDEDGNLEPKMWYERFDDYRLMGPDRSLLGAVNRWRAEKGRKQTNNVPGAWKRRFKEWSWKQRAEAWDDAERRRKQEEFKREREANRKERIQLLKAARGRLVQALAELDPKDARWNEVVRGIKTVVRELRKEYGDDGPRGTEDDPHHVVGHTPEEWKQRAKQRRQQAADVMSMFEDTDEEQNG